MKTLSHGGEGVSKNSLGMGMCRLPDTKSPRFIGHPGILLMSFS